MVLVGTLVAACGGDGDEPTPTSTPAAAPGATQPAPQATTPTGVQPAQKATLRIGATDAPPRDVTKILITVSEIQVQSSGNEPWLTVVSGPVEFDLVAIQGVEQVLGEAELDPGRYGQIRLTVEQAEVTVQGNTVSARVPSDKLKIVGGFDLVAGQTTILTLDFDAEKSVVIAGTRNVLIKPTVKLLVRAGDEDLASATEVGETEAAEVGTTNVTAAPAAIATGKSTVTVAEHPDLGTILVDGEGFTLYLLTQDEPGVSTCTGGCATSWPPLIASGDISDLAGAGVTPELLTTVTRDDGSTHVVYNGHPLYNFAADRNPEDAKGQKVGGVWFVVSPAGDAITE
ncbi:MAG: DUF4382 domain-containing protein [Chloroflexi bacterium]|nr:DUF4382 domain-containing protein [Chloroflexota bacterium]